MTISKTITAGLIQPGPSQTGAVALTRRRIRKAVLRYLRWRTVSQLQRLDPRTLNDFGIHPEEFLSVVHGLGTGDTP